MTNSIEYGADLINDVSGFEFDKHSIKKLKKYNIAKVLTSYARNTKYNANKSKI